MRSDLGGAYNGLTRPFYMVLDIVDISSIKQFFIIDGVVPEDINEDVSKKFG